MFFQYRIDDEITLELQSPFHARELFDLVNENQTFIGEYLAWAKKIQTVADIKLYMQRDLSGMVDERRWAWLIRYKGRAAGRIGLFVTMPALQGMRALLLSGETIYRKRTHHTGSKGRCRFCNQYPAIEACSHWL